MHALTFTSSYSPSSQSLGIAVAYTHRLLADLTASDEIAILSSHSTSSEEVGLLISIYAHIYYLSCQCPRNSLSNDFSTQACFRTVEVFVHAVSHALLTEGAAPVKSLLDNLAISMTRRTAEVLMMRWDKRDLFWVEDPSHLLSGN